MDNDIEIIKKHISPPVPMILKRDDGGEDVIYLKKLNVGQQMILSDIAKNLNEIKKATDKKQPIDEELNKKTTESMINLFESILTRSIDNADNETIEQFVLEHFTELTEILEKLMPKTKNREHAQLIKKEIERRNDKPDTGSTE